MPLGSMLSLRNSAAYPFAFGQGIRWLCEIGKRRRTGRAQREKCGRKSHGELLGGWCRILGIPGCFVKPLLAST
jgi:hypothetical protein